MSYLAWSVCVSLCVCWAQLEWSKTAEPIEMRFRADARGPKRPCIRGDTLAPAGEYDASIAAAAMRAVSSTAVAVYY